jgi:hypothetical protein
VPGGPITEHIADAWRLHFEHIVQQLDYAKNWEVYREYCIYCSRRYTTESAKFSPVEWQEALLASIQ